MKIKKTSLLLGVATALSLTMFTGCTGQKSPSKSNGASIEAAQASQKVEFPYAKALEKVCNEFPDASEGLVEAQNYYSDQFSARLGESKAKDVAAMIVFQKLLEQCTPQQLISEEENRVILMALGKNGISVAWDHQTGISFSEN